MLFRDWRALLQTGSMLEGTMDDDWLGHVGAAFNVFLTEDDRLGELIGDGLGTLLNGADIECPSREAREFASDLHALLTSAAHPCSEASGLIASGVRNHSQREVLSETIDAALRTESLSERYSPMTIALAEELAKVFKRPIMDMPARPPERSGRKPVSIAKGPKRSDTASFASGRQLGRLEGR